MEDLPLADVEAFTCRKVECSRIFLNRMTMHRTLRWRGGHAAEGLNFQYSACILQFYTGF